MESFFSLDGRSLSCQIFRKEGLDSCFSALAVVVYRELELLSTIIYLLAQLDGYPSCYLGNLHKKLNHSARVGG